MKTKKKWISLVLACSLALFAGCAPSGYTIVIDQTNESGGAGADIQQSDDLGGQTDTVAPGVSTAGVRINEGFPQEFYTYDKVTFDFVGDDVMPVSAWVMPDATDENYAAVADAGINAIAPLGITIEDVEKVQTNLDLCEKYGINFFLHNDYATEYESAEAMRELFSYALESPAFGGIAYDEPGLLFMKEVGLVHEYMQTFMSGKIFFLNNMGPGMAPISVSIGNTSGTHQQAAEKFQERIYGNAFIDSFDGDYLYDLIEGSGYNSENIDYKVCYQAVFDIMRPPVFSFDRYMLSEPYPYVAHNYYDVLSIGIHYAQDNGVPFWNYIQVIGQENGLRVMRTEEVLFQVNTSLAYGAKGINYFLYYWNASEDTAWVLPMLDADGNKTESYYNVQRANRQIAAIDEILLYSMHRGVIQSGWTPAPIPERDKMQSYGVLSGADSPHALIGCFDYDSDRDGKFESNVYYVTNNSVQNAADTVLYFAGKQDVLLVQDGQVRRYEGVNELHLRQDPGVGTLVVTEASV